MTDLAAGDQSSLALKSDGTVWAWGDDSLGQLGNGTVDRGVHGTPSPVPGLGGVVAVAAGGYHNLALKGDGTVWAWGENVFGTLGDGTTTGSAVPVQVAGLGGVTAIAGGLRHSMALKSDGTVWAWGGNLEGELGPNANDLCGPYRFRCSRTPVQVAGLPATTGISGGWYHSLAVASDGDVWAWGDNVFGELGDGTRTSRATPARVGGIGGVATVSGGDNQSLAVKRDGSVMSWGSNSSGELGNGTLMDSATPAPAALPSGASGVAAGDGFSLATRADGIAFAWGFNLHGQLGDGTLAPHPLPAPVLIPGPVPDARPGAGDALLTPGSVYFANQAVGTTSRAQDVTLTNTGAAPLAISAINASGDFGQSNDCGGSVPAGGHCTIGVTFTPLAYGSRTGALVIADSGANSPQTVPLYGTGASVTLAPDPVRFDNQPLGTASPTITVTLTNSGNATLTVYDVYLSGTGAGSFAIRADRCGGATIPVLGTCSVDLGFAPIAGGRQTATLRFDDDAPDSAQAVRLTGTGTAPAVSLSPASLSFGSQPLTTTSAAQAVTLTNTGTAPLAIGVTVVGDFARSTTCPLGPTALDPGASCTIGVTFTPTVTGSRTGTLTISDNAAGNPHTVALGGTGTATDISLTPPALTFGKQAIGATSAPQTVTVRNNGTTPLAISAIAPSGDFAVDNTTTCLRTLQPGMTCAIVVRFTATAVNNRTGAVTITDNAAGSPHAIPLQGQGPTQGFIFVHGIADTYKNYVVHSNSTGANFDDLLVPLQQHYNITPTNNSALFQSFESYEDAGNVTPVGCFQQPMPSGYAVPLGFPVFPNTGTPICDSNDDIGMNAILLDDAVRQMADSGVDRITIIANSMGGAITRSYLAYATAIQGALPPGRYSTLSKLEAVMFLQGAHEGAVLGIPAGWYNQSPLLASYAQGLAAVAQQAGADVSRPAIVGLTPQSAMYQFVNQTKNVPTYLHYANVASEIRLQPYTDVLGARLDLDPPLQAGDFLLLPGDDNPAATPLLGGARFNPSGTQGAQQWILPGQADLLVDSRNATANRLTALAFQRQGQQGLPQSHFIIDTKITTIASPIAPGPTLVDDLLNWLYALDTVP